jgi:hypothetical protein
LNNLKVTEKENSGVFYVQLGIGVGLFCLFLVINFHIYFSNILYYGYPTSNLILVLITYLPFLLISALILSYGIYLWRLFPKTLLEINEQTIRFFYHFSYKTFPLDNIKIIFLNDEKELVIKTARKEYPLAIKSDKDYLSLMENSLIKSHTLSK